MVARESSDIIPPRESDEDRSTGSGLDSRFEDGNTTLRGFALGLVLLGGTLSGMALMSEAGRERFGYAWLGGVMFVWSIVLGSLFFVALQHATRSVWSVVVRRVGEMAASPISIVAILFVPVLLIGGTDKIPLFALRKEEIMELLSESKRFYLNYAFFTGRTALYFFIWIVFGRYFVRKSLKQDEGDLTESGAKAMRKVSRPFLLIFGLT